MLSIVDLILARTIDVQLAAYLMGAIRQGASVLCCAGPGGTGKTTLMGALLSFIPPSGEIKVVDSARSESWYDEVWNPETPTWFICHELGPGSWYSYLWGEAAKVFLSMPKAGRFAATTVHADELGELRRLVTGQEIGLSTEDFSKLDLVLFIRALRVPGSKRFQRRVTQVHVGTGDPKATHRLVCRWDAHTDSFVWPQEDELGRMAEVEAAAGKSDADVEDAALAQSDGSRRWLPNLNILSSLGRRKTEAEPRASKEVPETCESFLQGLVDERLLDLESVRKAILNFYS